jgi:hypothetical protein
MAPPDVDADKNTELLDLRPFLPGEWVNEAAVTFGLK